MNEQEEIREIQNELDALQSALREQQQKVLMLQSRLRQLMHTGPATPAKKSQGQIPWMMENFIGLKLIQFIGIIVLVIGLSLGVKYAIDRDLISVGMRISLAYAAGAVLYILSGRLRKRYSGFSALLFSGGMASLYFTTYAAHVYYGMLPFALSFLIMAALTFYTAYEAIRYGRQEIALLGQVGAYGIPFLISRNTDQAELFFLYISLINAGVIFLCIRQGWKTVGRAAQAITWILFIGWASSRFDETHRLTGLLFMIFFYLLFLFTSLSFRLIRKAALTLNDTYQLLLNNLALYVSSLFVFGYTSHASVAMITLYVSFLTALKGVVMYRTWHEEAFSVRMLALLSLSLFVAFIGFNWQGFTVTLLWLLTAIIMVAWGFAMRSVTARMMAIVLMGLTLGKLIAFDSLSFSTVEKVIAYLVLGALLLIVSFFYQKLRQQLFNKDE